MSDYLAEDLATEIDYSAGVLPGTTQQADPSAPGVTGSTGAMLGTGTGQAGAKPLDLGGQGMGDIITRVYTWLNKPFVGDASPSDVFLLVGIVIIAVIAWNLILYHIRIAAEAI